MILLFPTHRNCSNCAVSLSNVNDRLMGACVFDSLGLGITCNFYISVCVQAITILSPLLFMSSLHSTC